ncbi:MAG: hypothetical protein EBR82_34340 [Caulobacteraceae bacterium]|nr:hypothetical protein [Caulobacteraceae bacterium]
MSNLVVAQNHSISEVAQMAKAVASSNLFGVKTPDQALALMLLAQAEGLHPMVAARDYHIIEGRPSMKADAMLARFQLAGGKVKWLTLTDSKVAAEFTHESGGSAVIDWDMDRAKTAGLGGKGNWNKYPRQMLRARVISEGIRTVFPACVVGVYTPEEVQDFDHRQAAYEAVPATIKPSPVAIKPAAIEALPEPASAPAEAVVDDDDIVGFREAIDACTTEVALKVVGEQIKKRGLKGAVAKELRDLFAKKKAELQNPTPVVEDTVPAVEEVL